MLKKHNFPKHFYFIEHIKHKTQTTKQLIDLDSEQQIYSNLQTTNINLRSKHIYSIRNPQIPEHITFQEIKSKKRSLKSKRI